jgi:hypothetical protein
MRPRSALPFVVIVALLLSTAAHAGAWIPAPGERYTEVRPGLFSSDSYHDDSGTRHPLVGGGLYEQRSLLSYSELGWKKHTSVFIALPAVSVTRRTGSGSYLQTQSGFGDMHAGFRIGLKQGATALAVQLEWIGPAGYRRTYTPIDSLRRRHAVDGSLVSADVADVAEQAPTLGTGRQSGRAMLQFGAPLSSRGFIELEAGYRKYDAQYADQYVASADLGFWLGPSLLLGGRYRGAIATGQGDTPGDKVTEHLSGPVLVYRLDDHMDVMAGSFHTASAKNALHVDQVYVGLAVKKIGLNRLQGFLGNKRLP